MEISQGSHQCQIKNAPFKFTSPQYHALSVWCSIMSFYLSVTTDPGGIRPYAEAELVKVASCVCTHTLQSTETINLNPISYVL